MADLGDALGTVIVAGFALGMMDRMSRPRRYVRTVKKKQYVSYEDHPYLGW